MLQSNKIWQQNIIWKRNTPRQYYVNVFWEKKGLKLAFEPCTGLHFTVPSLRTPQSQWTSHWASLIWDHEPKQNEKWVNKSVSNNWATWTLELGWPSVKESRLIEECFCPCSCLGRGTFNSPDMRRLLANKLVTLQYNFPFGVSWLLIARWYEVYLLTRNQKRDQTWTVKCTTMKKTIKFLLLMSLLQCKVLIDYLAAEVAAGRKKIAVSRQKISASWTTSCNKYLLDWSFLLLSKVLFGN